MTAFKMQLSIGCLSKTFSEQFDEYDIKYEAEIMAKFDSDMKTLNGLKFTDLFTHGQINTAYDHLAKRVLKHIHEANRIGDTTNDQTRNDNSQSR